MYPGSGAPDSGVGALSLMSALSETCRLFPSFPDRVLNLC
jgi:hypothetical protein